MPDRAIKESFSGGCLCGAIRFRIRNVRDAGYCHCSICRRVSGAPVLAWASVDASDFELEPGEGIRPCAFDSSDRGRRHFCPRCGSPVFYADKVYPFVAVSLGCLDDPGRIRPTVHMCARSRIPWFDTRDALPRFSDNAISPPAERESPVAPAHDG